MAKKVLFVSKPTGGVPNVEDWVSNRGTPEAEPEAPTSKVESVEPSIPASPKEEVVEKRKRLTLDIPESLHKVIKRKSVDEGVPMLNLIQQVLEREFLN